MHGVSLPKVGGFNSEPEDKLSGSIFIELDVQIMLEFYDIDLNYIDFLKSVERKVPNISYTSNDKFVCGVVLDVGGTEYYAPISHNKKLFRTSLPIYDLANKSVMLATVRFSFMVPAPRYVLVKKDFSKIRLTNPTYADLLEKEWKYCDANEPLLQTKGRQVYRMGCNPNHPLHSVCCNFPILEAQYSTYAPPTILATVP